MRIYTLIVLQIIMNAYIAMGAPSRDLTTVFAEYHVPPATGATHLCQQRVYGSECEIIWDALAFSSTPGDIVAFYLEHLGKAGFTQEGEGGKWTLPAGSSKPEWIITVSSVNTPGPHHECDKPIPPGTRSILLLSHMMRKAK